MSTHSSVPVFLNRNLPDELLMLKKANSRHLIRLPVGRNSVGESRRRNGDYCASRADPMPVFPIQQKTSAGLRFDTEEDPRSAEPRAIGYSGMKSPSVAQIGP